MASSKFFLVIFLYFYYNSIFTIIYLNEVVDKYTTRSVCEKLNETNSNIWNIFLQLFNRRTPVAVYFRCRSCEIFKKEELLVKFRYNVQLRSVDSRYLYFIFNHMLEQVSIWWWKQSFKPDRKSNCLTESELRHLTIFSQVLVRILAKKKHLSRTWPKLTEYLESSTLSR